MDVSIIVPAYNAQDTMERCLAALCAQAIPAGKSMEIIIIDDGSTDATAEICRRFPVTVIVQKNCGAVIARNAGIARSRGIWIAFTDSDCIPSRRWAWLLVDAAEKAGPHSLGAAGKTVGYESNTPAARFVDLSGGLDAEKHLAYHLFPFAPTANVLYRRSALVAVGCFDERYYIYDATDLHHRLLKQVGGEMVYEARAVVLHRHRATWKQYWKQQKNYGRGYAQLFLRYPDVLQWSLGRECAAWARLAWMAPSTLGKGEAALVRRGTFVKHLAQRVGFFQTYYNKREHLRFADEPSGAVAAAAGAA